MAVTLEQHGERIKAKIPAGRIGSPEDVAGTALFLSGKAGAFVNGELFRKCRGSTH
jgi:NAD(P)-dependent dehydrogenase (short-subunit alcohol dehydrogenase family)